jgi:hypothetical protein
MSKGLAWFAKQVPTEGFSDISEGRVAEKEIPHSDQWISPPETKSDTYRPDRFNRKSVIKNRNKGGFETTLIEELYQANEYVANKAPHGATYEQGRYVFRYPAAFQNSSSVNKRIAVRRIETRPRDYFLDFTITVKHNTTEEYEDFPIKLMIPSHYSIQEAGSAIKACFDTHIDKAYNLNTIWCTYLPDTHTVEFGVTDQQRAEQNFTIKKGFGDDILKLFNFPLERAAEFYTDQTKLFIFNNVRSRQTGDIFLHASFVSNSTAGYLGRDPEFYSKPSKMYADDGQNFFYIETSLDGYNKINLPYENFILELVYIIDSDNYDSP